MKIQHLFILLVSFVATRASAQNWSQQISGTSEHLISISFTDDLHGCVVGYGGVILKTVNGGASWTPQNSGTTDRFYSVYFTSANTGWAVGDAGLIRKTVDGGASWTAVNPPVSADFRVVWFLDANTGFIGGGFSSALTTILKTTDGGNTWTDISPVNLFPQQVVYGIFFTSPGTGYAVDYDGRLLKTTNGGVSWTAQTIAPNYNLHAIYFTDANTGYVSGGNIPGNSGVILKTVNGGNTWSTYSLTNGFLTDIKFLDANTGYAIGGSLANNSSIILKTTDAGNTWSAENTSSSRQFRAFFPSGQAGYSCGLDGTILKLSSPAQPCDNTFIQSLTNMGGSQPNIFPDPSGDFYATGMRNDSIVIVRFDQGGTPLWARVFRLGNDVLQIRDMFVDDSGDLIGVAFYETTFLSEIRSAAFRYNIASQSFVWVRYLAGVNYSNIHNVSGGDCVATGTESSGSTHLIRLDKNSGAVSGYNLVGDGGDYYSTVYNGVLYGACRRYYNGFQASVFAHDVNSGAFLWQNLIISEDVGFNTRMYPVKPVIDNNEIVVLASGDLQGFDVYPNGPVELVLAKTSLSGDVLWTKQYIVAGFDRPVGTAVVSTDGGYYLVANLYSEALGNHAYSVLIKTDKQGQVQWAKRLGISGKNIAKNVMERDGFLYLTMASDSYGPNDLLLLKLDQNGNTETGCDFVQPIAVETVPLANFQQARNYDPFASGISLTLQSAVSAETDLETVTYCNTPCICPGLFVSVGPDTTICAGESVQLTYSSNGNFTRFNWSPAAGLSCTDCSTPTASPASTTVYHLEATAEDGCIKYDSVTIVVNAPSAFTQNVTTCENEPFVFNGNVYAASGTYTDLFTAANGCDSLVTTNLVVLPLPTRDETIEFCAGESVVIGGTTYTQSGTVVQTQPGVGAACDTVVTYTLNVLPLPTRAETIEFCAGESVVIGGTTYTQPGTVVETLPGLGAACDTVVTYTLTVLPLPTRAETIGFCAGESVTIGGTTYTQPGTVVEILPGLGDACDTVVTYTLNVLPLPTRAETIEFCAGESVTIGGTTYTQPGTVVETLPGLGDACDTVVTYTLNVLPLPTRAETISFCPSETIVLGGTAYTQPGTVSLTIPGTAGCDTVVTYTLQYLTPAPSNVSIQCPEAVNIGIDPGAGPTPAFYNIPAAASDCPCPGIAVSLTEGLPSGALFLAGTTEVCYTALDSCGNSASCCFDVIIREAQACDIKEIGCIKYELLTITADAGGNRTYRIRVTNNCSNALIYTAIQLPDGITALNPPNLSVYEAPSGRLYDVRNPNYSPSYSIRFKSTGIGIANGQSDIFEYTLPAQAQPLYIHITSRLNPQIMYEAHLNTFNCPIGVTPDGDKSTNREDGNAPNWSALRLYPNPNPGVFTVELNASPAQGTLFRATDLMGQLVLENPADPDRTLQTVQAGDLPPGLYFLQVVVEGRVQATAKFVKQ
ncbi:MAG: YCF48-related protein [Saprospiraceae bacterium]